MTGLRTGLLKVGYHEEIEIYIDIVGDAVFIGAGDGRERERGRKRHLILRKLFSNIWATSTAGRSGIWKFRCL